MLKHLFLAPVIVPQALMTAWRAIRLPEAEGPRKGQTGSGPMLRLLILGDSSAAGVGVETQKDALAGQLSDRLAPHVTVNWTLQAQTGATAGSTLARLRAAPPDPCDVAVIALGVNDAKNGVRPHRWAANYAALLDLVDAQRIYVSALPPLGSFPLLPYPLRKVLGDRATVLDTVLRDLAAGRPDVSHVTPDFTLDPSLMARDGFHPGPEIYAQWAQALADRIKADLAV